MAVKMYLVGISVDQVDGVSLHGEHDSVSECDAANTIAEEWRGWIRRRKRFVRTVQCFFGSDRLCFDPESRCGCKHVLVIGEEQPQAVFAGAYEV